MQYKDELITKEEYDQWGYSYQKYDETSIMARNPSKKFNDEVIK